MMDSPTYGSSGIQWKRTDPKTVTLSNIPPEMQAPPPSNDTPAIVEMMKALHSSPMTANEQANYATGMQMRERQRDPQVDAINQANTAPEARRDRRQWRRQLRRFDKGLSSGKLSFDDRLQGVQEMLDSGAITITPDGDVYSTIPHHNNDQDRRRFLDAVREWGDAQQDNAQQDPAARVQRMGGTKIRGVLGVIPPTSDQPSSSTDEWRQRYESQFGR